MSMYALMSEIDSLIDDAKAAVLATVDAEGRPQIRWITPGTISERPGFLFIITSDAFAKVAQATEHPKASIQLQTRSLDKVLNLQGSLSVLTNPSIRSETLERIGKRLHAFWKLPASRRELVVLEFTITQAVMYDPQNGVKHEMLLTGEGV